MGTRSKRFGIVAFIAFIGLLLGISAYFIYYEALPAITKFFPAITNMPWVMWGLIGALLAVIGCLVYAYLPQS